MTPEFYDRAIARIRRLIAAIGLVGAAVAGAKSGLRSGSGFALGALLSYLSFHMIQGVAGGIGLAPARRTGVYAALFLMRYALLGAAVYVMVKYLEVSPMALLAGLFASAAAVLAEILYELAFSK